MQTKVSEVTAVMAEDLSVDDLGNKVLNILSRFLKIPVASMYVLDDDVLHLRAKYAHSNSVKASHPASLRLGETLLGEAIKRDELYEITNIPSGYVQMESSLGKAVPLSLVFIPLLRGVEVSVLLNLPWRLH